MTPRQLIRKVMRSKKLAPPRHQDKCRYVYTDGKHCIIGECLSQLGVPDDVLVGGWSNGAIFATRDDLVREADLKPTTREAFTILQTWWDTLPSMSSGGWGGIPDQRVGCFNSADGKLLNDLPRETKNIEQALELAFRIATKG